MLLKVLTMPQAKAAGLSADEDYTIEGFSVDVLVKVQGAKPGEDQYLINFDGASHFISIVAEGLKKRNRTLFWSNLRFSQWWLPRAINQSIRVRIRILPKIEDRNRPRGQNSLGLQASRRHGGRGEAHGCGSG